MQLLISTTNQSFLNCKLDHITLLLKAFYTQNSMSLVWVMRHCMFFSPNPICFLISASTSLNHPACLLGARVLALLLYVKGTRIKLVPTSEHLHLQFPLLRMNFTQIFALLIHLLGSNLCSKCLYCRETFSADLN